MIDICGSSLFRVGTDDAETVRLRGCEATTPTSVLILGGRLAALPECAKVSGVPGQIAN